MKLKDIKASGKLIYRDVIVDKNKLSEIDEYVKSRIEDADFVYVGNNQYYEQSTYELVFKVNEQLKDKLSLCSTKDKFYMESFFSQLKPREGQPAHSDQWSQIKDYMAENFPDFEKDTSAFLSLFESDELMPVLKNDITFTIENERKNLEVLSMDKKLDVYLVKNLNATYTPYIVVKGLDKQGEWSAGSYFKKQEDAERYFADKIVNTDNKYSDAVKYLIKEEFDCIGYEYDDHTIDQIYSEIMKDDAISTIFDETIINLLNRYTNSETEDEDIEISAPLKYPDEIKNKQIAEKVINTFEEWRMIEHKGYIYDVFVGDGQKSTYTYDDLLEFFTEEELEAIKKNSYSEVLSDWDISIITDMNNLGIYDENSNYNFYLSKEELCYLGLKQILVDMGCNELDEINENRQDENSLDDFDYEISM